MVNLSGPYGTKWFYHWNGIINVGYGMVVFGTKWLRYDRVKVRNNLLPFYTVDTTLPL